MEGGTPHSQVGLAGCKAPTSETVGLASAFTAHTTLSGFWESAASLGHASFLYAECQEGNTAKWSISEQRLRPQAGGCGRVLGSHAWSLRLYLQHPQPSMVVHAFTPRAWETEAGEPESQGHPGLHATLSQNNRFEPQFHIPCPWLFEYLNQLLTQPVTQFPHLSMKTVTGVTSQVLVRITWETAHRALGRPLAHHELWDLVAIFALVMY